MEGEVKNNSANTLKIIIGILSLAVIGLAVWLFVAKQDNQKQQVNLETAVQEKEQLVTDLADMKSEYATLQTNNDSLNNQLSNEREKIDLLLEKVKKTEARNSQQILAYKKELGTLRAIMKSYIVQIDSLNTVNQQLVAENTEFKAKVQETTRKYEEVSQKAEELTTKVQEGSAIKSRGMSVMGINKKGKDVERASRADKLRACVTLVENSIAERGIKTIYIRIKGPDGIVLTTSENNLFDFGGDQIVFSASRQIDYQGDEIDVCIYYDFGESKVAKGNYEVTAYLDGKAIGTAQARLK